MFLNISDEAYIDRLIAEADFYNDGRISYAGMYLLLDRVSFLKQISSIYVVRVEFLQVFNDQHRERIFSIYEGETSKGIERALNEEERALRNRGIIRNIRKRMMSASASLGLFKNDHR
jgi:hypothetical protein